MYLRFSPVAHAEQYVDQRNQKVNQKKGGQIWPFSPLVTRRRIRHVNGRFIEPIRRIIFCEKYDGAIDESFYARFPHEIGVKHDESETQARNEIRFPLEQRTIRLPTITSLPNQREYQSQRSNDGRLRKGRGQTPQNSCAYQT